MSRTTGDISFHSQMGCLGSHDKTHVPVPSRNKRGSGRVGGIGRAATARVPFRRTVATRADNGRSFLSRAFGGAIRGWGRQGIHVSGCTTASGREIVPSVDGRQLHSAVDGPENGALPTILMWLHPRLNGVLKMEWSALALGPPRPVSPTPLLVRTPPNSGQRLGRCQRHCRGMNSGTAD